MNVTLTEYYKAEQVVRSLGWWIGLIVILSVGAVASTAYGISLFEDHPSWAGLAYSVAGLCALIAVIVTRTILSERSAVVEQDVHIELSDGETLKTLSLVSCIKDPEPVRIVEGGLVVECEITDRDLLHGQPTSALLYVQKVIPMRREVVVDHSYEPASGTLRVVEGEQIERLFGPWFVDERVPSANYWGVSGWRSDEAEDVQLYNRIEVAVGNLIGPGRYRTVKRRCGDFDLLGFMPLAQARDDCRISTGFTLAAIALATLAELTAGEFDWFAIDYRQPLDVSFEGFSARAVEHGRLPTNWDSVIFCVPKGRLGLPSSPGGGVVTKAPVGPPIVSPIRPIHPAAANRDTTTVRRVA